MRLCATLKLFLACKTSIASTNCSTLIPASAEIRLNIQNFEETINPIKHQWIFDSGAACNLVCTENVLMELDNSRKPMIKLPSGQQMSCAGVGNVILKIQDTDCIFKDVLLVPEFNNHLISVENILVS